MKGIWPGVISIKMMHKIFALYYLLFLIGLIVIIGIVAREQGIDIISIYSDYTSLFLSNP